MTIQEVTDKDNDNDNENDNDKDNDNYKDKDKDNVKYDGNVNNNNENKVKMTVNMYFFLSTFVPFIELRLDALMKGRFVLNKCNTLDLQGS